MVGRFRFNVELMVKLNLAGGGDPGHYRREVEALLVGIMHLVGECREQLDQEGNEELWAQLDALWGRMAGDYWA